jgi:hypothetical protein
MTKFIENISSYFLTVIINLITQFYWLLPFLLIWYFGFNYFIQDINNIVILSNKDNFSLIDDNKIYGVLCENGYVNLIVSDKTSNE